MKHRLFAFSAAAALLASASVCGLSASAAKMRDDIPAPDWIPSSFAEGMAFLKTYGATHVQGDVVCYVQAEYDYSHKYKTEIHHTGLEGRTDTDPYVWENSYNFEIPEPPAFNASNEELDKYHHLCQTLGWDRSAALASEGYKAPFHLTVHAYWVVHGTNLFINTETRGAEFNTLLNSHTYSFHWNAEEEKAEETDIYAWLPDCEAEFAEFREKNEAVSVQNDCLVYAEDIIGTAGYEMTPCLTGTAMMQSVVDGYVADPELIPKDGGTQHRMLVYRPLRPGLLRAEFITVYKPDGGSTLIGKDFEIDNDLHIKPYTGEIGSYYPGDCNGDDELTIGDAVVLNNYLTGNGELKNWQTADLNGDSAVNALDLTIQKRRIIENSSTKPRLKSYVSVNLIEIAHRSIQTAGSELCFKATVAYADCIGVSPKQVSSLFLYDAETDQQLAAFTQDEEDGGYYVCSIPAKDMTDKKFYAAAKFYNAADGKPEDAELIKSATVSLKGDKDALPVSGKDNEKVVTLKTKFSEYGIGTTHVNFIAEFSKELFPYVDSVTLYDENDEKVVQMTPDANKNLYDCTVTVNTDAPCTKQFSAVVEYKPDAAMSVGAITKICIDVPFQENPAP